MPTFISEVKYEGGAVDNFVEVALPVGSSAAGFSVVIYDKFGAVSHTFSFGAPVNNMGGQDVYLFDTTAYPTFPDLKANEAVALVDNSGTVVQFISFKGNTVTATNGPAVGTTSTMIGSAIGGVSSLQSDNGGASYFSQSAPNSGTIPCYAPGTLIDTPDGPRAVESLQVGDLVETLDHGPMPIRWMRQGEHDLSIVRPDQKPVLIAAGAFGPGCPARDLVVSPQHRIPVGAAGQLDGIFGAQYFAPAKALTGLPNIRAMLGVNTITWVHFALDTHEVVWANGCLSESLLLGAMVLNELSAQQHRVLAGIYGLRLDGAALNGPVARDCLKVRDLQRTIDRLERSSRAVAQAA